MALRARLRVDAWRVFCSSLAGVLTVAPKTWAQGARPSPTAIPRKTYGIPEKAPLSWPQDGWTIRRQQCIDIFNELSARESMPRAEAAKGPNIKTEDVTSCLMMKAGPVPPPTTADGNALQVSPVDTSVASPTSSN